MLSVFIVITITTTVIRQEETLGGDVMFTALMAVIVSQLYIYSQTHRVVYIIYVQLFTCQSDLNKVVFKN